jgi:hypothetical protein
MNLHNLNFWMVFFFLILRYIYKMATDGGGGEVDGRGGDFKRVIMIPGRKLTPVSFVFAL